MTKKKLKKITTDFGSKIRWDLGDIALKVPKDGSQNHLRNIFFENRNVRGFIWSKRR